MGWGYYKEFYMGTSLNEGPFFGSFLEGCRQMGVSENSGYLILGSL